ncbi:cache domain-containing protein [Arcobacter sp. CECT 8985]|uniref:cache domain-containing protein n=1 Tax=Arcobacter sp. CECT 8985 TaxID=1935424 RepID=UPI00100BCBC7|nr:cache domain-containing protein [Arcobacter sp. CECT 8985]RXJ86689.1 hypothetical protein CRU93_07695 [Arcobacter sp. CECT 8985]
MTSTISVSVKTKIIVVSILIIFFIAIASLIGTIFTIDTINNSTIDEYKTDIYDKKKKELENYVQIAINTINYFYIQSQKQNAKSTDIYKKQALELITKIRYSKNGYFWVNNSKHIMIMHPILKNLNSKDLTNMKDKEGNFMFKDIVFLANQKKEGGVVMYMWPKPNEKLAKEKFSYVKKFEPWDWIVGTGAYLDEVDAKVAKMKKNSEESFEIVILICSIIFVIVLIIISLMTLALSTKRDKKSTKEEYE